MRIRDWSSDVCSSDLAGELDLGQPLGGGDVAVQAGGDEAGGEAVLEREGLAVHAHRDQRIPVEGGLDGEAAGVAVDGAADELVGEIGRESWRERVCPEV